MHIEDQRDATLVVAKYQSRHGLLVPFRREHRLLA
jgi:hypothetical protein